VAKRLGAKLKKQRRDTARAYAETKAPWKHKVARERSVKAKLKKAYPAT